MKILAFCFVVIFVHCISNINGDVDNIPITHEEFLGAKNAMDFSGKVAIISGSSSGLGAATAQLLAFLGAKVVVTGRNGTRVEEVVSKCRKLSPCNHKPIGLALDLTIPGNIAILVNETTTTYGKIDILVNNAGIGSFALINESNFNDVYLATRAINEEVQIELTRQAVPYIKITGGTIIFTSSLFARNPIMSSSAYSMSKNALMGFAMTLMHELGNTCRVNVISPTIMDGTRIFRLLNPFDRQKLIGSQIKSSSLGRAGVPMDYARTVAYLASPLASFITGKEIQLDGGLSIPILG